MTPTTWFGRNPLPKPEPPPRGLLAFLRLLRGLGKGGALGRFRFLRFATKTHRLMEQWIGVDDDDLRKTLDALRIQARYGKGGSPSFYMEALAAVYSWTNVMVSSRNLVEGCIISILSFLISQ